MKTHLPRYSEQRNGTVGRRREMKNEKAEEGKKSKSEEVARWSSGTYDSSILEDVGTHETLGFRVILEKLGYSLLAGVVNNLAGLSLSSLSIRSCSFGSRVRSPCPSSRVPWKGFSRWLSSPLSGAAFSFYAAKSNFTLPPRTSREDLRGNTPGHCALSPFPPPRSSRGPTSFRYMRSLLVNSIVRHFTVACTFHGISHEKI